MSVISLQDDKAYHSTTQHAWCHCCALPSLPELVAAVKLHHCCNTS